MLQSILLRFRDIIDDTIPQHEATIARFGSVWWGWWRKPQEPNRLAELEELRVRATGGPIVIGLYDRSRPVFYQATLVECAFDRVGGTLGPPSPDLTPEYYRRTPLPAWFRLSAIAPMTPRDFAQRFGQVPTDDSTFCPLTERVAAPDGAVQNLGDLRGQHVLHITDIHFGTDFGFTARPAPGRIPLSTILIEDVRQLVGRDVGLIVVSGDLSSRGDANPLFNAAIPFLDEIRTAFGLEREHIVVVPGNHDIPYSQFSLMYDHEAAFNAFLKEYYGAVVPQQRLVTCRLPNGRPLEMLTMSSVKLRTKETSNYGWVDWLSCEAVLSQHAAAKDDALRIAVLHHHLVTSLREERLPDPNFPFGSVSVVLNAGAVIEGLQANGFHLVLHGHQHNPSVSRVSRGRLQAGALELRGLDSGLHIVAGGSAGVTADRIDGDIRDNTYGLISLGGAAPRLVVRGFVPTGAVHDVFAAQLS